MTQIFADQLDRLPESPDWLASVRQKAAAQFRATGLPTPRDERWKYTNLNLLDKLVQPQPGEAIVPPPLIAGTPRAVFIDGLYRADLSSIDSWSKDIGIWNMKSDIDANLNKGWVGSSELASEPLHALNTALFTDGLRIILPFDTMIETPLEICFVGTGSAVSHVKLEIDVNRGASASIIERHVGTGSFVSTIATEIGVDEYSRLQHYRMQATDPAAIVLASSEIRLNQNSLYDAFSLTTGGRLSRHQILAIFDEGDAEVRLNGAHILSGNSHADTTTEIRHMTASCRSRETYRHVMDGTSRSVFQGKIFVAEGAQKTDGFQLNQSLMLSPTAEVNAKPELEIYADDVKCSHGATSGRLDEEALFYLRSRGIPAVEAKQMLIEAFIGSSIDMIEHDDVRAAFRAHASAVLDVKREARS